MEERHEEVPESEPDLPASTSEELTGLRLRLAALDEKRTVSRDAPRLVRVGLGLLVVAALMLVATWAWTWRSAPSAAPAPAVAAAAPPAAAPENPKPPDATPATAKQVAEAPPVQPATPPSVTSAAKTPAAPRPAAVPKAAAPPPVVERAAPRDEAEVAADRRAIQATVGRYREGFTNLDVNAVRAVWPSANEKELAREFGQLQDQRVEFHACNFDIKETTAAATCTGVAAYVQKAGDKNPRFDDRRWVFTLKRAGSDWVIQDVVIR